MSVDAIWDDDNNVNSVRPENFEMRLFADGKDTGKKISMKSVDGAIETFGILPMYNQDGTKINYTVVPENYKN
ncbi:MAG: Cna B-type domain-containing protein [Peptostreptococcus porci]|nr:Cna B-type domain-containing protein [Peptostreptococcus porci]